MSKTKVKHVFRDGLNCGGTDWYPMATYVLFQSALSVKTTNAYVQAAPTTSVQAPNHTSTIRGVQPVCYRLAEEQQLHQVVIEQI